MTRSQLIAFLSVFAVAALFLIVLPARAQGTPVRWVMPADGQTNVWSAHRISIEFDRDMNRASVEAGLTVEPGIEGHFEWPVNNLRHVEFVPHDLHSPGQHYVVELAAGTKDAAGNVVFQVPYEWSFTAGDPTAAPRFSSGPPVHPVSPSGGRGIPFQPGYPRAIFNFSLFSLDAPAFAARYLALTAGAQPNLEALAPGDLSPAATWQAAVDASGQPAYVALPEGTPPGLYLLEAKHPHLKAARTLLVYSNYSLAAKTGHEGLLAWVSSIPDGTAAPGAVISIFDSAGQPGGTLAADEDGLARLDSRGAAAVLVADVAGQPAALALDGWWYSDGNWYSLRRWTMKVAPDVLGHVFTDRPIYRPGHVVHWKASLRRVTSDGFKPLATTVPVTVTIRDAAGNAIQQTTHNPDEFGSVDGQLALGDEVGLGRWRIEVRAAGRTVAGSFQVEEYVKPDFEVAVESDAPFYIRGQSAQLTVQADYYFGQPVAGGEVTVRVFDNRWWSRNQPLVERTGTLNDEGRFELAAALVLRRESDGSYRSQTFTVEAEVVDASRRPVYATARLPVHPADFALSVRNWRYGVEMGQPVELDITTMRHDGAPAAGRPVAVVATRSYWYGSGTSVKRATVTTDAGGRATLQLNDLDRGWYRIVATAQDDAGREVRAQSYAWLYSSRYPWYWKGNLEIEAGRDSYAPGDTARLLVKSPITTTALVTLEQDEVLAEYVVELVGATAVEVQITDDMAPGVTARVALWEPLDPGTSTYSHMAAEGRLIAAQTRLIVPAEDKRLAVEVEPDRPKAGPGEPLGITLRVRDSDGIPVRAQVALAVVDKAVLALAEDANGNVFDAFWSFRSSTVNTHDGQRIAYWWVRHEYDRSQRYWGPPAGSPTGAAPTASPAPSPTGTPGAAAPEPDDVSPVQPRREFPDTAYWSASILTDELGEARITLTLPDSLTTWQALARAIDLETRAGQGTAEVVVSKPVIAEPALPRFVVQGDTLVLDVLARNYATTDTISGSCTLQSPGLFQLDPGERVLELPFNNTRVARWSAVATDVGVHEMTAWLQTDVGDDGIVLPLEVQPFTVPERFAFSGAVIAKPVTETFTVPFEAHPDASVVEVRLSSSLAAGVLEGLEDLIGYPYGCVEQTMSRMLPNAVIGRLITELDIQAPEITTQLPAMMALGLQKLYGFQLDDGSWGWWRGNRNIYITSWVLHGLSLTKQAGYDVDPAVLDRGFNWLAATLPSETDPRLRAYGTYVLAIAGRGDDQLTLALYAERGKLDAFSLAALAQTLDILGHQSEANVALDDLLATVVETPTTASWPLVWPANRDWAYHWKSMASSEKNTAMALLAMSRLRPTDPLAPKSARWLMENRRGRGWISTQATAFAVLALTDYIVASGELWATYDWRVTFDGQEVASGRHEGGAPVTPLDPIKLTGAQLAPGPHRLRFEKTGEGTLYYTAAGRLALYYPDFEPISAEGSGIEMKREYMPIEGRAGTDGWQPGDLINVRVTVKTTQDLHYVIIEDMLPAGFEAVNTALDTETRRLPSGQRPWWRWWGYERREIRDEKVTFFDSWLRSGTHTFEYAARAVTPGTFAARPAEAYAMYRPEVWGRSASRQVKVATRYVAERPVLAGDFDRDCRLTAFDASLVAADWGDGALRRDVNGDGRLDAADIATADGRAGLVCGDTVPLPAGSAGEVRLRLIAPEDVTQGEAFDLAIQLDDAVVGGAWEITLELPAGAFEVLGTAMGDALPGARRLAPVTGADSTVRLGGYVPGGVDVAAGTVLATVRLRAGRTGDADIGVLRAQIVRPDGGSYTVSTEGVVVSPEPWSPAGRLWLPSVEKSH